MMKSGSKERKGIEMAERKLTIIFGTETGNAEELAEDTAILAKKYDLTPNVVDMEDISADQISEFERLVVVCSTWGEGDQPVNAQDLYDDVCELGESNLEKINFAVLALGDSAFEFFCESGKEWDSILEKKGGSRINERIDCDTDYDDYVEEWINDTLGLLKDVE
ncbi:MAG: hypothetical protein CMB67_03280 [Euryarchaeota archaeon]|nr:hypothetical protein [Euryarchaeota archaeon]